MRYNPFKDYDKHGCLKVPLAFYLALAFLLRSYVIWIVALSYREDSAGLLSLFYPSRSEFTMALLIASPALIVVLISSLRRLGMPKFVQKLWHNIRAMMIIAAVVQLTFSLSLGNLSLHNLKHILVTYPIIAQMIGLVLVIGYCLFNRRLRDASLQFPQEEG